MRQQLLTIYYQPQIETNHFSTYKLEALLRWFPKLGKAIPPSQFIPVAEQSGLIFEFEITESILMTNLAMVAKTLSGLRKLNIKITIDDFGTGYSSLKYLQSLPIDSVKIDRSFVLDLAENTNNQSIVSAIISLSHKLHLKVVAEGAENQATVSILCQQQCDLIQGYYFCKPMPADEVFVLLSQQYSLKLTTKQAL